MLENSKRILFLGVVMTIYEAQITYKAIGQTSENALDNPQAIYDYAKSLFVDNPLQEQIYLLILNRKYKLICHHLLALGTEDSANISFPTLFRKLFLSNGVFFALVHNHPSGDPEPSRADIMTTKKIDEASKILETVLIDHVICGEPNENPTHLQGFYSFKTTGLL